MIVENTVNPVFFVLSHYLKFTLLVRQILITIDNTCYVNLNKKTRFESYSSIPLSLKNRSIVLLVFPVIFCYSNNSNTVNVTFLSVTN